jgi:hypothetical protein
MKSTNLAIPQTCNVQNSQKSTWGWCMNTFVVHHGPVCLTNKETGFFFKQSKWKSSTIVLSIDHALDQNTNNMVMGNAFNLSMETQHLKNRP